MLVTSWTFSFTELLFSFISVVDRTETFSEEIYPYMRWEGAHLSAGVVSMAGYAIRGEPVRAFTVASYLHGLSCCIQEDCTDLYTRRTDIGYTDN